MKLFYHLSLWWVARQFVRVPYWMLYGQGQRAVQGVWKHTQAFLQRHLIAANRLKTEQANSKECHECEQTERERELDAIDAELEAK